MVNSVVTCNESYLVCGINQTAGLLNNLLGLEIFIMIKSLVF